MKTTHIKQKLEEIGVPLNSIVLGDFDIIGEYCAKRTRSPGDENYKRFGFTYKANYERGIILYYLIRQFNLRSMLEIGTGRGYATFCAARAFHDSGFQGTIKTIDPNLDEKLLSALTQVFPADWFKMIQFFRGTSQEAFTQLGDEKFDLIYIDGDHSYEGTKFDWEGTKDRYTHFLLFDDYHLPTKNDPGIQCNKLIDEINDPSKELLITDRRIFLDDRGFTDDQVNYGQVLITKEGVKRDDW